MVEEVNSPLQAASMPRPRRRMRFARRGILGLVLGFCFVLGLSPRARAAAASTSFSPTPTTDETYGESFTIIAEMSDHTYLLFQFLFSNAGVGDRKAACRLMLRANDRPLEQYGRRFDEEEWRYIATGNRLQVGECSLTGDASGTRFHVRLDGVDATLHMKAPARNVMPVPTVRGDWGFYQQDVLTPWAQVDVTLQKQGQEPWARQGWGYFDHTRSEALLPKVASNWVRFRGFYDGVPLVLQARFAPDGTLGDAWMWRKGERAPERILEAKRLTTAVPQWEFKSAKHTLHVETGPKLYLYEPTKSYGLLGRLARPFVGNPKTHTYRAALQSASLGSVRGTVEWSQIDR